MTSKKYTIVSGYVCSGSSIICDLLREVKGIGGLKDGVELKLIKEPYGLIDLQNALVVNS